MASGDDPMALPKGKGQGWAIGDNPLTLPKGMVQGRESGDDPLEGKGYFSHDPVFFSFFFPEQQLNLLKKKLKK